MATERYNASFHVSHDTPFGNIHNMSGFLSHGKPYTVRGAAVHDDASATGNLRAAVIMHGMYLLSVIGTVSLLIACWGMFYSGTVGSTSSLGDEILVWTLYAALVIGFSRIYNAFNVEMYRVSELVYSQVLTGLISSGILYVIVSIGWSHLLNPIPLLGLILIQALWDRIWSLMAKSLFINIHPAQKTLIVYRQQSDLRTLEQIKLFPDRFDVQKYIKDSGSIHQLIHEIRGYESVFVVGVDEALRNGIAKYCIENGVQCYIAPHVGDVIMAGAKHMHVFNTLIMKVCRSSPSPEYLFVKKALDIIGSVIGIICTSPFMLVTALAIKLYDGGPVLYKQVRLTRDRREFLIWKFRSMRVDAEKDGVARLAVERDERITPVGRVIRAVRFDELPQLFNILGGSMTFVGPRPERPEIAEQYEKAIPAFSLRLQVVAGLTGYAQVYGRYNTEPYDKLRMDLMYINNMSVAEDLRLMFATVKILFMKESTVGVGEGHTTAVHVKSSKESAL